MSLLRGFTEISCRFDGFSLSGKVHSLPAQPSGSPPAVQDPADEPTVFIFDPDLRFLPFIGTVFDDEPENAGREIVRRDEIPILPLILLLQPGEKEDSVLFQKFGMLRIIDGDVVIELDPTVVFCVRNIDRTAENTAG